MKKERVTDNKPCTNTDTGTDTIRPSGYFLSTYCEYLPHWILSIQARGDKGTGYSTHRHLAGRATDPGQAGSTGQYRGKTPNVDSLLIGVLTTKIMVDNPYSIPILGINK